MVKTLQLLMGLPDAASAGMVALLLFCVTIVHSLHTLCHNSDALLVDQYDVHTLDGINIMDAFHGSLSRGFHVGVVAHLVASLLCGPGCAGTQVRLLFAACIDVQGLIEIQDCAFRVAFI